jgi:hypothetical protein
MSSTNDALGLHDFMKHQTAMTIGAFKNNTRATSLGHPNSIQHFTLFASYLDIKLPSLSSVTDLTLFISQNYHIDDLRTFLQPVASHLTHLSVGYPLDLHYDADSEALSSSLPRGSDGDKNNGSEGSKKPEVQVAQQLQMVTIRSRTQSGFRHSSN